MPAMPGPKMNSQMNVQMNASKNETKMNSQMNSQMNASKNLTKTNSQMNSQMNASTNLTKTNSQMNSQMNAGHAGAPDEFSDEFPDECRPRPCDSGCKVGDGSVSFNSHALSGVIDCPRLVLALQSQRNIFFIS